MNNRKHLVFAEAENLIAVTSKVKICFFTCDLRHFGAFMNRPDVTGGIFVRIVAEFPIVL